MVRADNLCSSILTAVLQAQGNVDDHEDAGRTVDDIKDWSELSVAECVTA